MPIRVYDKNGNGLTVGDTSNGYFIGINVNQMKISPSYNSDKEHENIKREQDVLETGFIELNGQKSRWHLIQEYNSDPGYNSLFISYIDSQNHYLYVIHALVDNESNFREKICSLEHIIKSFRLKK